MEAEIILRIGICIVMVVFGIHKFYFPHKWISYIPPWAEKAIPVNLENFMRMHGISSILFGSLILFGIFQLFIAWVTLIWWLAVLPFAFYYEWDVGVRELTIIFAILTLILLI